MEKLEEELTTLFHKFSEQEKVEGKEMKIKIFKSKTPENGKYCSPSLIKFYQVDKDLSIPARFKLFIDKQIQALKGNESQWLLLQIENLNSMNGYLNFDLKFEDQSEESKTELKKQTDNLFQFKSLGQFKSCFKEKFGTPKQSGLLTHARSSLILSQHVHPSILQGIQEYSHIWIIFVFHAEMESTGKTYNDQKGKVAPPKLEGEKVGIFATRSPHRPNPIGLSLAKLEQVNYKDKIVYFSGLDLIEGTPILDIKPYHPADSLQNFKIPGWLQIAEKHQDQLQVKFMDHIHPKISQFASQGVLQFYKQNDVNDIISLIENCLSLNPHSTHTKKKFLSDKQESKEDFFLYGLRLDNLVITYKVETGVVTVVDVEQSSQDKIRTEKWLKKKRKEVLKLKELKS